MAEGARGRRGLGRGLSALLGESAPPVSGPAAVLRGARRGDRPEPEPAARSRIDEGALDALAASIRASGVLQPILVAPAGDDGRHRIVAGERRWRAARMAGPGARARGGAARWTTASGSSWRWWRTSRART